MSRDVLGGEQPSVCLAALALVHFERAHNLLGQRGQRAQGGVIADLDKPSRCGALDLKQRALCDQGLGGDRPCAPSPDERDLSRASRDDLALGSGGLAEAVLEERLPVFTEHCDPAPVEALAAAVRAVEDLDPMDRTGDRELHLPPRVTLERRVRDGACGVCAV